MPLHMVVILFPAGIVGGLVNALAGGATLITFPAMLAAGLPAIAANASNAVAISPGHLIAALADRSKLPALTGRTVCLAAIALFGGAVGASVLLLLPERLFVLPVPALVAFATLLFALAPRIQARRRAEGAPRLWPSAAGLGAACIYGGFFGAGLGVILTAVLAVSETDELRAVKALKNLLASCVALASTVIFVAQGAVHWPETSVMLAGALIGGYGGGHLIRILPAIHVRRLVIAAGVAMSVVYAARYWG